MVAYLLTRICYSIKTEKEEKEDFTGKKTNKRAVLKNRTCMRKRGCLAALILDTIFYSVSELKHWRWPPLHSRTIDDAISSKWQIYLLSKCQTKVHLKYLFPLFSSCHVLTALAADNFTCDSLTTYKILRRNQLYGYTCGVMEFISSHTCILFKCYCLNTISKLNNNS